MKLRILHVSDIHFRSAPDPASARADEIRRERPRRARVMEGKAWQDNIAELLAEGPLDLVCLTGDIADWGNPQEYEQATRFVDDLLSRLSLPRARLFVVPGNHDIDRCRQPDAWTGLRSQPGSIRDQLSDWLAGGKAPAGVDDDWPEQVRERQAAFWGWVEHELGRAELLPSRSPHRRLGYRIDVGGELGLPVPVWILGLDTAWLAGDDHDAGKLLLTKDQLMLLGSGDDGHPLPGFRIALGHHPLAELADGGDSRTLLASYADVYLHGHQHQPITTLSIDPDRHLLELAAGCLFEGTRKDEHPNGLQVIELHLDDGGRPLHAELRFRTWSARGEHWYDDGSIYRHAKLGRLPLTWPSAAVVTVPSSGAQVVPLPPRSDASAEARPKVAPTRLGQGAPVLFGREEELARIEAAWADSQTKLMTIVAWGGVGKTALVHEFRNRVCMRDEPAWVFDWSFYSQGTRDIGAVSAESFIRAALLFFGDAQMADSNVDGWTKGARLAELIGERRSLVILDGLEPLQEPPAVKGAGGGRAGAVGAGVAAGARQSQCGVVFGDHANPPGCSAPIRRFPLTPQNTHLPFTTTRPFTHFINLPAIPPGTSMRHCYLHHQ